jgi:phytoene/squalene synthetase
MAVLVFDAYRRGRLISQQELDEYSRWLATSVTEAMHYFIGHDCASPRTEARYLAVTAAHIAHMLRDACQDTPDGFINIPREFIETHGITAQDFDSSAYRMWVRSRVELARSYFKAGEKYLAQVENTRCRLAGYAYTARFSIVLDAIERNGYLLKANYPECKRPSAALRMSWYVLSLALNSLRPGIATRSRSQA